ncbi:hypothetical protein IWQ61_009418 [Dispira simplex]|nr:hypothetical protein IWQ61_009418 [Dispira simplex]
MSSDPSKTHGNYEAAAGTTQNKVGETLGNESMQAKGKTRNVQGRAEHTQAENQGYAQGMMDRMSGAIKSSLHGLTGNRESEALAEEQRDRGEAKMNANK